MNRNITLGILFSFIVIFSSCKKEPLIGKWDDIIKLSSKEASISYEEHNLKFLTEGTWWWINSIALDDDWTYDFSDVNTTQDKFLLEFDEFTIVRKNATELLVYLRENKSDSERVLKIGLQAGDYFDSINITQAGK